MPRAFGQQLYRAERQAGIQEVGPRFSPLAHIRCGQCKEKGAIARRREEVRSVPHGLGSLCLLGGAGEINPQRSQARGEVDSGPELAWWKNSRELHGWVLVGTG